MKPMPLEEQVRGADVRLEIQVVGDLPEDARVVEQVRMCVRRQDRVSDLMPVREPKPGTREIAVDEDHPFPESERTDDAAKP